jgi:dTDP-4-dehydrorhamnose reductase
MTVLLLGGSGFIGGAFQSELKRRFINYTSISRAALDYTRFETLWLFLKEHRPKFVINAAGVSGIQNIDWCEEYQADTLLANVVLPATVANACAAFKIPWGHISSGCIYNAAHCHQPPNGFTEQDTANFTFRARPYSFYSGSKALGEEVAAGARSYIWRIRMPFSAAAHPKNLLSKLQTYTQIYDNPPNSLSHLGESVAACLDLWQNELPYGIWNIVNPGALTNRQIAERIQEILKPERELKYFGLDEGYLYMRAPRSNCILSPAKLLATGIEMRPVGEALTWSLEHWQNRSSVEV